MARVTSILEDLEEKLHEVKQDPTVASALGVIDTPRYYTSTQAKTQFGVDLPDSDYLLKVNPLEKGYSFSYVTPSNVEVKDDNTLNMPDGRVVPAMELGQLYRDDQSKGLFGNVMPSTEINTLRNYAKTNPNEFLNTIRQAGKTPESLNLVNKMFPSVQPEQIDKIFYVPRTNVQATGVGSKIFNVPDTMGTISKLNQPGVLPARDTTYQDLIKKAQQPEPTVPRLDTFGQKYLQTPEAQAKLQEAYNINPATAKYMVETGRPSIKELPAYQQMTSQMVGLGAGKEYIKQYGEENYRKSLASLLTEMVSPSIGKQLNPERPDITWQDIAWDLATIGSLAAFGTPAGATRNIIWAIAGGTATGAMGSIAAKDPTPMNIAMALIAAGATALDINVLVKMPSIKALAKQAKQPVEQFANEVITNVKARGLESGFMKFGEDVDKNIAQKITPEVLTGEQIAKQVGAKYDGIQEGIGMQFTDNVTHSTTYGNTLEEVQAKITKMRQDFAGVKPTTNVVKETAIEQPPVKPPVEPPTVRKPIWEGKLPKEEPKQSVEEVMEPVSFPSGKKPPVKLPTETPTAVEWQPSGKRPGGEQNIKPTTPVEDIEHLKLAEEALEPETKGFLQTIRETKDAFMRKMYQETRPLKELSTEVGGKAWQLAKVVPGARTWGERLVEKYTMPIYRAAGKDLKDFATYLTLKRNEDILAKYGPETKLPGGVGGWGSNLKAIDALKTKVGDARFTEIESLAKELWAVNDEYSIGALYNNGLIDIKEYLNLKTSHPHYVPFYRQGFDKDVIGSIKSIANVTDSGIKGMEETGSTRKLLNVLASNDSNIIKVQERIAKNNAAKGIINDLEMLNTQTGIENFSWVKNPEIPKNELKLAINDNDWGTVSFLRNGEEYTANVPRPIAVAAKALEETEASPLLRFVRALNMPLLKGAVVYNPAFMPVNIIRDAFSAFYRERLIPLSPSYLKGWKAAISKNEWFDDATREGTLNSGIVETMLRGDKIKPIKRTVGSIPLNNVGDYLLAPARFMEKLNLTAEQATRIATYIKKRGQGLSGLEAAVVGRDATVDFAQSGTVMRDINMIVPFSNASLQGAVNTVRTMRDHPFWAAAVGTIFTAPTVLTRLNNMKWETSEDIPHYEYTNYWVYQFGEYTKPDGTKGPIYTKIPKGQIASMLTFPAEALINYQQSQGDKSLAKNMLEGFVGALKSTSPVPTDVSGFLPPLLDTAINVQANKNLYTGMPIVPMGEQELLPEQQYGEDTSKVAIGLGQQFKTSPRMIDFAIKNYTAGTGQTVLYLMDKALEGMGYNPEIYGQTVKEPQGLAKELSQTPVAGRFFGAKATELERQAWESFDKMVEKTNREFAQIPGTNTLGIKLGEVGDTIKGVELKTDQRVLYQQLTSDAMKAVVPELLNITKGIKDPAAQRGLVTSFISYIKQELGEQYLAKIDPKYELAGGKPKTLKYMVDYFQLKSQYYYHEEAYKSLSDPYSKYYIADGDERATKQSLILTKYPDYAEARHRMYAYSTGMPESEMDAYVQYKVLEDKYQSIQYGDTYKDNARETKEREAFLKANPTFAITRRRNECLSADPNASESIISTYIRYFNTPSDKRDDFRRSNSAFDKWLQTYKGYKPLESRSTSSSSSRGAGNPF